MVQARAVRSESRTPRDAPTTTAPWAFCLAWGAVPRCLLHTQSVGCPPYWHALWRAELACGHRCAANQGGIPEVHLHRHGHGCWGCRGQSLLALSPASRFSGKHSCLRPCSTGAGRCCRSEAPGQESRQGSCTGSRPLFPGFLAFLEGSDLPPLESSRACV